MYFEWIMLRETRILIEIEVDLGHRLVRCKMIDHSELGVLDLEHRQPSRPLKGGIGLQGRLGSYHCRLVDRWLFDLLHGNIVDEAFLLVVLSWRNRWA
jgi:hypothetical protein